MELTKEVATLLRDLGFPIFVCLWFMWRLEKRIDAIIKINSRMCRLVLVLARALDLPEDERRKLLDADLGDT